MSKRSLIILLAGLNVILLAVLVLGSWRLPGAYAQAAPLGQNFVIVAGEIRDGVDGLYVVDLSQRRLHVFVPNREQTNRRLFHAGYRDLQKDFRGGR